MLIGIVLQFGAEARLDRKYFGLSILDHFIETKKVCIDERYAIVANDEYSYTRLKNAFKNVLLNSVDAVETAARMLHNPSRLPIAKIESLIFYGDDSKHSNTASVYAVFSDETDKVDAATYMHASAFTRLIERLSYPGLFTAEFHSYIISKHEKNGVEFIDPKNTYIDATVTMESGCKLYPNVYLEGDTHIGAGTIIYPGCRIIDSKIGKGCSLQFTVCNSSIIEDNASVGPFVNIRPNTHIRSKCKIGDFVEIKNSEIGEGSKVPHLSYIGDGTIGERVNVGCGSIFVNYDGVTKSRTVVGNDVFIGCNSNLIAPIEVGDGAYIAAGSTLTMDVPKNSLAIARARQVNKTEWYKKRKQPKENEDNA